MTTLKLIPSAVLVLGSIWAMPTAQADDHAVRHHAVVAQHDQRGRSASQQLAPARNLTINRRPVSPSPDDEADAIFLDGSVRYNNIRTFDPAPYADSGRQYPFGLDGIGGYGSDLGFSAGHDAALYDRGP